jgi:hypothetical protein
MEGLTRRYPAQDQGESVEEYFADYEQLAIQKGVDKVAEAVALLRIDPEQDFFPTPTQVARKMEYLRLKKVPSDVYARG